MTNLLDRFGCRRASEGDPSRRVCAVAAPLGEQSRSQSLSIPVLTCDVPSFSTPLITEEGLGVGGAAFIHYIEHLTQRFGASFVLWRRIWTTVIENNVTRRAWTLAAVTHPPQFSYLSSNYSCRLCVNLFTQLHVSKRCVSNSCGNRSHTWAGSFVYWWTRNTTTWATGCNPAGTKLESGQMNSKQPGKPSNATEM